jgi:hypothetical protein
MHIVAPRFVVVPPHLRKPVHSNDGFHSVCGTILECIQWESNLQFVIVSWSRGKVCEESRSDNRDETKKSFNSYYQYYF